MNEISLHILDIIQNSIRAGADLVEVLISKESNTLHIEIRDNGVGMDEETIDRVTDPFATSRTTRKVGLGIPLFKETCENCNGTFEITSKQKWGTYVRGSMQYDHIDRPPLGKMVDTMMVVIHGNPKIDFRYVRSTEAGDYHLDTREVKEILGNDVPVNDPAVIEFLVKDMEEGEKAYEIN